MRAYISEYYMCSENICELLEELNTISVKSTSELNHVAEFEFGTLTIRCSKKDGLPIGAKLSVPLKNHTTKVYLSEYVQANKDYSPMIAQGEFEEAFMDIVVSAEWHIHRILAKPGYKY